MVVAAAAAQAVMMMIHPGVKYVCFFGCSSFIFTRLRGYWWSYTGAHTPSVTSIWLVREVIWLGAISHDETHSYKHNGCFLSGNSGSELEEASSWEWINWNGWTLIYRVMNQHWWNNGYRLQSRFVETWVMRFITIDCWILYPFELVLQLMVFISTGLGDAVAMKFWLLDDKEL